MTNPTPNRPLWQVMQDARPPGLTTPDRFWMYERDCCAAELRAIAEAVQTQFTKHFADGDAVLLEVINWLLVEADCAEAGGMIK
jgi:hypothetical protein